MPSTDPDKRRRQQLNRRRQQVATSSGAVVPGDTPLSLSSLPSVPAVPSPALIANASHASNPSQPANQAALCQNVLVNLGELGEFEASLHDKWGVCGLVVDVPNHHWPGHVSGETPCKIVGFIDKFPWPPEQSQSNESAYVVETQGEQYALQPLQIEDVLPPLIRRRIAARPAGNRPRGCEWDPLRMGFFDKTTGARHLPGTRSVISQDGRRVSNAANMSSSRSDTYDLDQSECSWLIPHGGDIDKWRWLPEQSFLFPDLGSRGFAKLERTWRLVHMDLRVGPLGGFKSAAVHPGEAIAACAGCRAPLFLHETRTKCCAIAGASRASWCGPFCSFPYIPRPTAEAVHKEIPREYGALWYGDGELSKYFLTNTRLFNSRYAFSSLQATRERHPGKPYAHIPLARVHANACLSHARVPHVLACSMSICMHTHPMHVHAYACLSHARVPHARARMLNVYLHAYVPHARAYIRMSICTHVCPMHMHVHSMSICIHAYPMQASQSSRSRAPCTFGWHRR